MSAFTDEFQAIPSVGSAVHTIWEKIAKELTPEARADVPKKDFAVSAKKSNTGHKAYPIEDRQHAISALGFSKMHHDKADIAEVRKDVAAKYPDLVKKGSLGSTLILIQKHAEACMPKKGKEKDGNMGMSSYGPSSAPLPGMVGGPAGGMGQKAGMTQ